MNRKLLIVPYFGDLPPWFESYRAEIHWLREEGYDMIIDVDERGFRNRVRFLLDLEPPPMWNTGKTWDFRPALGLLYANEITSGGYEWWGHTDLDCVYGRISEFVTDNKLDDCDIYSDCSYDYLAGPWTLHRVGATEIVFQDVPDWREQMLSPDPTAWQETSFSDACKASVRVTIENNHAFGDPQLLRRDEGRLMHGDREVSFFHFNRLKVWPL